MAKLVVVALVVVELPPINKFPLMVDDADERNPPVSVESPVTESVPLSVVFPEVSVPKEAVVVKRLVEDAVVVKKFVEVAALSNVLAKRVVEESCAPLVALS